MEIVHISRDELSYIYRHWMVVTFEDLARYYREDQDSTLREACRDLVSVGVEHFYEDYYDARLQAERWLCSMKYSLIHGDDEYTDDIPDPDEIEDDFLDQANWISHFFFSLLTSHDVGFDDSIPVLSDKQILAYGRIVRRTFHSTIERKPDCIRELMSGIPQLQGELDMSVGLEIRGGSQLGGLFIEAAALELFKRYEPNWKAVLSLLPDSTVVVY